MPTPEHFADRLLAACRAKGAPVCVGLDPVYDRLPPSLRKTQSPIESIHHFCRGVLEAIEPHVPCVKIQSACFERYRAAGVEVYHELVQEAADMGLLVIGDAKRGDIGVSAAHYAAGNLADDPTDARCPRGPDALTINSYFGEDGIEPFIQSAVAGGKGLFALVRTSNPGGDAIQGLPLRDGGTVAEAVAQLVAQLGAGENLVGRSGYSLLGAVVGATKPQDAARLRELMPQQIFLVPGFGAQGAGPDEVRPCFDKSGNGAIITASRSVIFAFQKGDDDWRGAIASAAADMKRQVAAIVG